MKKRIALILVVIVSLVGVTFAGVFSERTDRVSQLVRGKKVALVCQYGQDAYFTPIIQESISNVFGSDVSTGEDFGLCSDCDLGVVVEMVDYQKKLDKLNVRVRLAFFDLTGPSPRALFQRTFKGTHPLPKADHLIDYEALSPSDYAHTPLAIAYHRLGKELSEAITGYFQGIRC